MPSTRLTDSNAKHDRHCLGVVIGTLLCLICYRTQLYDCCTHLRVDTQKVTRVTAVVPRSMLLLRI
jgi:hypothetical protein